MRHEQQSKWVRPSHQLLRDAHHRAAGTLEQLEWLPSAAPAGGLLGLIVLNLLRGVAVVWDRWKDLTSDREVWMLRSRAVAVLLIGGLTGWLVIAQSSHLVTVLAAAALALAVAVGLLG